MRAFGRRETCEPGPELERKVKRQIILLLVVILAIGASVVALRPGDEQQSGTDAVDPLVVIRANGCLACHSLAGEGAMLAPAFETLHGRDVAYIRRGIVDPAADTAAGFESFAGTMPPTFARMLSSAELEALVEFLRAGPGGGSP